MVFDIVSEYHSATFLVTKGLKNRVENIAKTVSIKWSNTISNGLNQPHGAAWEDAEAT